MDGSSFHSQYYRYLTYEKYNKKPKVIIQTIDIATLKKTENLFNYQQFLPYLDDETIKTEVYSYDGFTEKNNLLPFQRYFGEYKISAVGLTEYFDIRNFSNDKYKGYKASETKINYTGLGKLLESKKKILIPFDDESIALFETFLKHCKESGIKLILVHPPTYIENQSVLGNYEEVFNIYKKLAKKYEIPLINYDDQPIALRKDLFNDGVHLNKTGAKLFSETFLDDLLNNYGLKPCITTLK